MFTINPLVLPHLTLTAAGNPTQAQPLTSDNLRKIFELAKLELRYNAMLHQFELTGKKFKNTDRDQARVMLELEDTLLMLGIKNLTRLPDMLMLMAQHENPYHPMEDWILSAEWDKRDHIAELLKTVPTDSELWPAYLKRWLVQVIEGVRGWRDGGDRSLPHVLTFVGGQGAGKGRWLRTLAPGFVLADAELHLNAAGAKDHQLQALAFPIVELGEIDSTFRKSDVSSLKSFLSRPVDVLRAPYARNALKKHRMTSFVGSVNQVEFLADTTGSRRFWPVELRDGEMLDWDHGIDMQQVFAQADEMWCEGEDWSLNDEEDAARVAAAEGFTAVSPGVDLVAAHWDKHKGKHEKYAILNKTSIARVCGASTHPAELAAITAWLRETLGKPRKLQGRFRSWAFPVGDGVMLHEVEMLQPEEAKEYILAQNPAGGVQRAT